MRRLVLPLIVLAGLCAVRLFPQQSTPTEQASQAVSISGVVTDPAGAAIPNVQVDAKRLSDSVTVSTRSDSQGRYQFRNLMPGQYEITFSILGFAPQVQRVTFASGKAVQVNATLRLGQTNEQVSVDASARSERKLSPFGKAKVAAAAPPAPIMVGGVYGGMDRRLDPSQPRRGIRRPSGPFNTEQYDTYVENEFSQVKNSPLSTFSTDVDTASYSNVRRFLNEGRMPPAGSVRIEELINYFSYDYPVPENGKPVSMTTQLMNSTWNHGRQLLQIGLRTKPIPWENTPPCNLTFLIDVSGSMMPYDRLPLIKQGLKMLVTQLRPEDQVAMVVYAGAAGVVLPPTKGSQAQVILDAIDRLEAGGSTHGSAGIRLAYELARDTYRKKATNRVILATDGDFNVGVSSDSELVSLIEKERESGIFLSVLGVGRDNLKDSRMEKLADHGNGNYSYLDSMNEARRVLVQQMGATLVTVAKDVKLQIEFNPEHVKAWRLVGYENRLLRDEDFNDDKKDAGDLGAGHQVTAFYELIPAGSDENTPGVDPLRYQKDAAQKPSAKSARNEVAWLKLRYKEPTAGKSELLEWPVSNQAMSFDSAPADTRFAAAVAEYGILLRGSKFKGDASFGHALQVASRAVGEDAAGPRAEFLELLKKAAKLNKHYPEME